MVVSHGSDVPVSAIACSALISARPSSLPTVNLPRGYRPVNKPQMVGCEGGIDETLPYIVDLLSDSGIMLVERSRLQIVEEGYDAGWIWAGPKPKAYSANREANGVWLVAR